VGEDRAVAMQKAVAGTPKKSIWSCILVAVTSVAVATVIRLLAAHVLGEAAPFVLYYPAVMAAAWCGGFATGALATFLSAVAADFFFINPRLSIASMSPALWVALAIFVLSGVFISFLSHLRLQALQKERALGAKERDLRDLLTSEKEFVEGILGSIGDAFCVLDHEWRFLYANDSIARVANLTKEQIVGKTMWEVYPEQEVIDRPRVETTMKDRVPVHFETYHKTGDRWFAVSAFPCGDGISVYAVEITEPKRLQRQLQEAREQMNQHAARLELEVQNRTAELRETVEQLEHFSYTVSHDLRSPLRAMQAFAHMALEEEGPKLSSEGREYLKRIDSSAQRMDRLIQDVITYTKVSRMSMPVERVNTEELIDEVIHQYPSVNKPNASFEIQRPLDSVVANPAALVQALSQVLGNAVKFVGTGDRARVKVSSHKTDSKVCLCIEDCGIGIEEHSLQKVFEPFHRAHSDAGYEGTGIGLAVAKKAVERMGGKIDVKSVVGIGSSFCIELPAA
jgi:PAS domain S-box-containing protein